MTRMQYGEFLLEQNPRRIEVTYGYQLVTHTVPSKGACTQNLGARCRVVRCEGEVFAPDAQSALQKLSALGEACRSLQPQLLYLPTGEQFSAFCSRFAYTAQGDGRILSYLLEFTEASSYGEEESE